MAREKRPRSLRAIDQLKMYDKLFFLFEEEIDVSRRGYIRFKYEHGELFEQELYRPIHQGYEAKKGRKVSTFMENKETERGIMR